MWVAIQMCIEAMLGITLYSYLYPKIPKTLCFSYHLLYFLFNKIREEDRKSSAGSGGFGWEEVVGEVAQKMYTHVSKCKNDKIKREKINSSKNNIA
jgi:hypothetical protein